MNARDAEQVVVFRSYLLRRAERSGSRLIREQVRRWVEWLDDVREQERDQRNKMNRELRRAA